MEASRKAPYLFVSPVKFSVIKEVETLLTLEGGADMLHPKSVAKAVEAFRAVGRGVFVISASEAGHLKVVTAIAIRLAPHIRSGAARIIVVSPLNHPNLPKLLKKYLCEDQISLTVNPKGLKIKLQRFLSLVDKEWQAAALGPAAPVISKSPGKAAKVGHEVLDTLPLKITEDCWIMRAKPPRKVQGHWIVQLMGPGPSAGRWIKAGENKDSWHWLPHDPTGNPFVKEGRWTFNGKQPEHRDAMWTFIGENAGLLYTRSEKEEARRFYVNAAGNLVIAENSEAAKAMIPEIQASIEFEVRVQSERGGGTELNYDPGFEEEDDFGLDMELAMELDLDSNAPGAKPVHRPAATPPLAVPVVPELLGGIFGDNKPVEPLRMDFYRDAQAKLAPRPGLFGQVNDPKDREVYLRESAEEQRRATIWTRGQAFRTETDILEYSSSNGTVLLAYPDGLTQEQFNAKLKELGAEELLVNANLSRAALFFRQPLQEIRTLEAGFELKSPTVLYEVQRRAHFRFPIPVNRPFEVRLEGGSAFSVPAILRASDIGAGGFCLKLDPNMPSPQKGATIGKLGFRIYNHAISCAGEVRWVTATHMGIQFVGIDPYDMEGIKLFIMEESYQYLSRFLAARE